MLKRLLAWLLVNAAIFFLTMTFLAWVIDVRVLNTPVLTSAMKDSGVYSALATAIPELSTQNLNPEDAAKVKTAFKSIIDEKYVTSRANQIAVDFVVYMKGGEQPPLLDLSDLPAKLKEQNIDLSPDQTKAIAKPIAIGGQNQSFFKSMQKSYGYLQLLKYTGPLLVVGLLVVEWFISDKRRRLEQMARIFVPVGLWAFMFWFAATHLTNYVVNAVKQQATFAALGDVAKSLIDGVNLLVGKMFFVFGVVCLSIGALAYILHFIFELREGGSVSRLPDAAPKSNPPLPFSRTNQTASSSAPTVASSPNKTTSKTVAQLAAEANAVARARKAKSGPKTIAQLAAEANASARARKAKARRNKV